ncbi:MAG: sugar phosphate nucleotidyltransferase [Candidatus Norongarragalinales archaeon]
MACKFVVLAAGSGTRLWPITEEYPKPLARVLGKPLLGWILDAIAPAAKEIVVVVGAKQEKIREYVAGTPHARKTSFAVQEKQLGTGHAILQAASLFDDDFVVLNGDFFASQKFYSLLRENAGKNFFVAAKRVADGSRYGVISEENGFFKKIREKPANARNCLANTGAFFVPAEFKKFLKALKPSPRGELEATDALNAFAEKNDLKVLEFDGYWDDIGSYWNLVDANLFAVTECGSPCVGKASDKAVLKGKVILEEGARILDGAVVEGPSWIAANSVVKGSAKITRAVIEENCFVSDSQITGSLLMRESKCTKSNVFNSVLCENSLVEGALLSARENGSPPILEVNNKKIECGDRAVGSVVGARAKVLAGARVKGGSLVGVDCVVGKQATVQGSVPSRTTIT